jgi:hypothetical protein
MISNYLSSVISQFDYYKSLGESTFEQLTEEQIYWQPSSESNSIATIVMHLKGNMLSRWTDFLSTDGEKEWRNRDIEFENSSLSMKEIIMQWNLAWNCLFDTLNSLSEDDFNKIVYIRNQPHSVIEAINRQMAHYPYHIGQIVFIGKMICNENWKPLSIPKGQSRQFNAKMK